MKRLALLLLVTSAFLAHAPAAIKRDPREVLLASQEAFEKRDFKRAIELLTQAIEQDEKLAPAYVLRGLAHGQLEDHEKAIADFGKAIELSPEDPRPWLMRAGAYEETKKFEEAISDYTAAIRLTPHEAELYCYRGLCYARQDEMDKAIADYDKAVEVDPKSVRGHQLRGAALSDKGDKEKALSDFKRAIELDSNNAATYLFRAQLYLLENEPELALADYEEVMKRAPNFSGALNDYAWTLATNPKDSIRDGRKAVDYAKKACYETDYKHAPTIDTLAAAHAEAGDWEEAVKWQMEAVKLAEKTHPEELAGMKERVALYKEKKPFREQPKRQTKQKP